MLDQMKLKISETDSDMIELITESPKGRRTMWGACHIDLLWQKNEEDRTVYNELKKHGEINVTLSLKEV